MAKSKGDPGAATDSEGRAAIDPTKNVDALVEAAVRRLDDLRSAEAHRFDAEIRHSHEMAEARADHARELRLIEKDRLDAIRAVDVGAVQRAAEVQATQAGALAAQVVATADAFRVSLAAALEPIQKDIRDLRDAQSRTVGGKDQNIESSTGNRAWIGVAIAAVVGFSSIVLGVAAIAVTLILRTQ